MFSKIICGPQRKISAYIAADLRRRGYDPTKKVRIGHRDHGLRRSRYPTVPLALGEHTADEVAKLKQLTTQTALCLFLRLCCVLRRFAPNFAKLTRPLNDRLRKSDLKRSGHRMKRRVTQLCRQEKL